MASNPPPAPTKPATATKKGDLVPPDEAFWVRYSAHHEFPLSAVISFTAHVVALGLLILIAFKLISWFNHPASTLPVEAVRLEPGGGGSRQGGEGDRGAPSRPQEAGAETPKTEPLADTATEKKPQLEPIKPAPVVEKFDLESSRTLTQVPRAGSSALARLNKEASAKVGSIQEGSRGRGGSGGGGGRGQGRGTGEGAGVGPGKGKGNLTRSERRNLRWWIDLPRASTREHIAVIADLGGIIAIPVRETANGWEYKVVRDLHHFPAQLLDEDISQFKSLRWEEVGVRDVPEMLRALGVQVTPLPPTYLIFFPQKLEDELAEIEKDHAEGHGEDDIEETHFEPILRGGHYRPVFKSIRFK